MPIARLVFSDIPAHRKWWLTSTFNFCDSTSNRRKPGMAFDVANVWNNFVTGLLFVWSKIIEKQRNMRFFWTWNKSFAQVIKRWVFLLYWFPLFCLLQKRKSPPFQSVFRANFINFPRDLAVSTSRGGNRISVLSRSHGYILWHWFIALSFLSWNGNKWGKLVVWLGQRQNLLERRSF